MNDPELPAVSVLLSASAFEVLASAIRLEGGVVQGFRRMGVSYRPGQRIAVTYEVAVDWGGEAAQETVVALADHDGLPNGAVTVSAQDTPIAVWRTPKDPYLPGLARATDPDFVRGLLDEIGAPPGRIELEMRSYWPRRRAVIEAKTLPPQATEQLIFRPGRGFTRPGPRSVAYLKVVRPSQAAKLHRMHDLLSGAAPVARCQQSADEHGVLVLASLPGETLWECVRSGRFRPPDGRALVRLLDRVEQVDIPRTPRMTSRQGARHAARLLVSVLPEEADRMQRLIEALGEDRDEPLITVHGDFHEVQVLVDRDGVCGLLDLDDVGPGQRLDDLAMMAGRFWSFVPFTSRGRERVAQYALELVETFAEFADPEDLHQRVAGVLVARATSPFRSQVVDWPRSTRRAIELAERWLDRSDQRLTSAFWK